MQQVFYIHGGCSYSNYEAYLNDLRRRKLIAELLKDKKKEDSLKMPPPPADSIKNQFQKIEAPLKSRLEFGIYSGLAIFNGTISQSSLISNDKNLYNGINITIKFEEHIDYSRVGIREHIKNISKNYDKIFVLIEYNSRNLDIESFNNVEILYFKVDENYHESQSYIEDFLSKFRIISSASINFKH